MVKQLEYAAMQRIFARFQSLEPEPKGELHHLNAYTLLVAVALSAQSTDVGVNRATAHLFQLADSPQKMVALGEVALIDHIKTIVGTYTLNTQEGASGIFRIDALSRSAVRKSFLSAPLTQGKYEFQVKRQDEEDTSVSATQ